MTGSDATGRGGAVMSRGASTGKTLYRWQQDELAGLPLVQLAGLREVAGDWLLDALAAIERDLDIGFGLMERRAEDRLRPRNEWKEFEFMFRGDARYYNQCLGATVEDWLGIRSAEIGHGSTVDQALALVSPLLRRAVDVWYRGTRRGWFEVTFALGSLLGGIAEVLGLPANGHNDRIAADWTDEAQPRAVLQQRRKGAAERLQDVNEAAAAARTCQAAVEASRRAVPQRVALLRREAREAAISGAEHLPDRRWTLLNEGIWPELASAVATILHRHATQALQKAGVARQADSLGASAAAAAAATSALSALTAEMARAAPEAAA